ncbi:MAG: hypothetical protein QOF78_967 [Phycisphaerales bacterium]|jgi:hypothetical protein|nr:hypothetical protein [Phycisphaerales bacterium]
MASTIKQYKSQMQRTFRQAVRRRFGRFPRYIETASPQIRDFRDGFGLAVNDEILQGRESRSAAFVEGYDAGRRALLESLFA